MAATLTGSGELTYLSFPIVKTEKTDDGDLLVYGKATDGSVDSDEQIVDPEWSAKALQDWLETGGNVRVQHNPSLYPAGKGIQVDVGPDGHYVKSLIVEPTAKRLVEKGVLTAYSVGISRPDIVRDSVARNGRITGGPHTQIVEISLVDRPANKNCGIQLMKANDDGSPEWVGKLFGDTEVTLKAMDSVFNPADLAKLLRHREVAEERELAEKRDMDQNVGGGTDRDKIPAADFAGRNRSFPIVTPGDVSDAAASIGRAGSDNYSSQQLRENIIRIARRKGQSFVAALPQSWRDDMDGNKSVDEVETAKVEAEVDGEKAKKKQPFPGAAPAFDGKADGDDGDDGDNAADDQGNPGDGDAGDTDEQEGAKKPGTTKAGGKNCPNCGKTYHTDAKVKNCENCGTKLPKATKAVKARKAKAKMACACGKAMGKNDAFCPSCGKAVSATGGSTSTKAGKPTPGAGVTGETTTAVPAHREPDGAAIEALEHDAHVPTVPDADLELKAATRLRSLGVPQDLGAIHDLTCAAYHPQMADKCHPTASLTTLDVNAWQQKALRAATGAPLDEATRVTKMWQNAITLCTAPAEMLEELRTEANKAFQDANPGPGSAPTPGELSPSRFNRPYISDGHAAPSPDQTGPNHATIPTREITGADFNRDYLAAGHGADSPSNKGSAVIEAAPVPPHMGRAYYTNAQRDSARSAMQSMHDHIAQTFPDLCPMTGSDGGGQPASGQRPVPVPVGASKMVATGAETTITNTDQVTYIPVTELTADTAVFDIVTKMAAKLDEVQGELKTELKAVRKRANKLQEAVDALCDLPDPSTAPFKGIAQQHPIATKMASLPVGARTVAETAEQAQQAMMAALQHQARTNPDPAQREAAWTQLYKMTGISTGS